MYQKYRYTPLASATIADALAGLHNEHVIPTDVYEASEHVPLRFDPIRDTRYYRDSMYWTIAPPELIETAAHLIRRIDQWYDHRAGPLDKALLAVAALTESDECIGTLIDTVKTSLVLQSQTQVIDADNSVHFVTDYQKACDPVAVKSALNTELAAWWRGQFEKQARRVITCPRVPFDYFRVWAKQQYRYKQQVREYFRRDPLSNSRFTVRQARRVVNRSIRLFAGFFGDQPAHEFLRGQPLAIVGHHFRWVLQLDPASFIRNTLEPSLAHVPYDLSLHSLEGVRLASACVVFDAPVLDQAIAIGLSVGDVDDELALLKKTNVFNVSDAGYNHPVLSHISHLTPLPQRTPHEQVALTEWEFEAIEPEAFTLPPPAVYRQTLRTRRNDPISNCIRQELFRMLDVRPDVLEYMACPEAPLVYLYHTEEVLPLLRDFIEYAVPLGIPQCDI